MRFVELSVYLQWLISNRSQSIVDKNYYCCHVLLLPLSPLPSMSEYYVAVEHNPRRSIKTSKLKQRRQKRATWRGDYKDKHYNYIITINSFCVESIIQMIKISYCPS